MDNERRPARVALSIVGLIAVAISLGLNLVMPFGIWNWLLLLVAVSCIVLARRV